MIHLRSSPGLVDRGKLDPSRPFSPPCQKVRTIVFEIEVHGTSSTALLDHANLKLTSALNQHSASVLHVSVKLEDLNGRSKGHDKRCHITVKVKHDDPVIVEEIDDDMYLAVSRAADRVKQVVGRHHDKKMAKLHGRA